MYGTVDIMSSSFDMVSGKFDLVSGDLDILVTKSHEFMPRYPPDSLDEWALLSVPTGHSKAE